MSFSPSNFFHYLGIRKFLCACLVSLLALSSSAQESYEFATNALGLNVQELQNAMNAGRFSAQELSNAYIAHIAQLNPTLNAVLEINPDALSIARMLDEERSQGKVRSALHGIPVLLKDNIDTADNMHTSAGSLALLSAPKPSQDAFLVRQLREAGAVILGKTNLSEWANFRSTNASSGWSARGGQTHNPYDQTLTPCGSSSGSAVAVAVNLAPLSIGTETNGSIICPAAHNSIVGLKPSLGLVSRAGIIPIAHSQDTAGPMGRNVIDVAILLNALVAHDPSDDITDNPQARTPIDYTQSLDRESLQGKRIGVMRQFFGHNANLDALMQMQLQVLTQAGAVLIDVDIRPAEAFNAAQLQVLLYEFKNDINKYLLARGGPINSLENLIQFNRAHAETEMPNFGQELFLLAQLKGEITEADYLNALRLSKTYSQASLDTLMQEHTLDAFVAPSNSAGWAIAATGDKSTNYISSSSLAAAAGYPSITVPAGYDGIKPIGISFMGGNFSEPTLLSIAYAFEQITRARKVPALTQVNRARY